MRYRTHRDTFVTPGGIEGSQLMVNLLIYAIAHGVVDAACTATVFSIFFHRALPLPQAFGYLVLYIVLGFGLRPVLGLLVDHGKAPRLAAALGCIFAGTAALLHRHSPVTALVIAGLGNALFHVGGGGISFNITPGMAAAPGIFAAPGAAGLVAGTLLGKSGAFHSAPFAIALLLIALAIPAVRPPAMHYEFRQARKAHSHFEMSLLLILLAVALGAFIGLTLSFPWKTDPRLLAALTFAIVFARGLGGFLGDRFGWLRVSVCTSLAALPFLSFGAHIPAVAIAGVFLFNIGIAIAATAVANVLPGRPSFAFGLVSLGLILGALPAYGGVLRLNDHPALAASAILLLAALSCAGLRLYFKETSPGSSVPNPGIDKLMFNTMKI